MPALSSPYKSIGSSRYRSTSPLPPPVPAKPIDLNSSTRSTDKETGAKITRRAFLCDVVVEREGEETSSLLAHLGRPLAPLSTLPAPPPPAPSRPHTPSRSSRGLSDDDDENEQDVHVLWNKEKHAEMGARLANLIEELVRTERSYLMRIQALKKSYADPLRNFARQEFSKIIPMYEAKTLFTNIDAIVTAATTFLEALERVFSDGGAQQAIGDVCLTHLRDLKTFDPYRTYLSKQDEAQKMFQDVLRKHSSFGAYIERTKYQTTGIGNIGLRELLMEPVQRIPRYTLLWQTMIKCMAPMSPQRAKLVECIEIASRIAKCEPDPQTVRATVMYCLERNVDGFPANLFSNNRDFIDSIDVDDLPVEYPTVSSPGSRMSSRPMSMQSASTSASTPSLASIGSSASSTQLPVSPHSNMGGNGNAVSPLHCTLFLFDDKLMVIKRQSSSVSGRKVTGLDDVAKLVKSGGGVAVIDKNGAKKDKLSYRGIVDVLDIIATDVGNGDFHLFFERPPMEQGDRWSARPFRSFTSVQPPFGTTMDPVAARRDKLRFLQNLWSAQALARAKISAKEAATKAVPRVLIGDEEIGLDAAGEVFGRAKCLWNVWDRPNYTAEKRKAKVAIHIDEEDLAPELSLNEGDPCMVIRLQPMAGNLCRFSYATAADDGDGRVLIDMSEVLERITTIIARYGVFKFRTAATSCPTTPSNTGHRLRPSMLNLDAISRNLFGQASVSSRSQTSSDMFGTSSTRRKSNISRTSTMDTRISLGSSLDDRRGRFTSPMDGLPEEGAKGLAAPSLGVKAADLGQSELDLNERLNLARKNSRTMAAMSPPNSRLGAKSVSELRSQVETRSELVEKRDSKLAAKSIAELRRHDTAMDSEAEAAVRQAVLARSGSPTPLSPTLPLRVRNKTPSPTRVLEQNNRSKPLPEPIAISSNPRASLEGMPASSHRHTASLDGIVASSLPRPPTITSAPPSLDPIALSPIQQMTSIVDAALAVHMSPVPTSPRQLPNPPTQQSSSGITAPLSPRPHGPRSPVPKAVTTLNTLGSARTRLRIVSGNGRRVSVDRETVPLKGADENDLPKDLVDIATPMMISKRQHSEDQLTPRKRSPTRSPLQPRLDDQESRPSDAARGPSNGLKKTQSRRTSGHNTPRKISGGRRASAGTLSVASQHTGTSVSEPPTPVIDHPSTIAAVESSKRRLTDSRAAMKRLKADVQSMRKQLGGEARTPSTYSQGSLPRSPHRRTLNRLADTGSIYDETPPKSRFLHSKQELDTMLLDETARGVAAQIDKVDGVLRAAIHDGDQAEVLALRFAQQYAEREMEVQALRAQVARGKETQELLRQQLSDVQVEVDVIYEAFNTELDGMFNDSTLPQTEAFEALKRDVQESKAERNSLKLENMRLNRELEEANLKREQWSRMLRDKGVL